MIAWVLCSLLAWAGADATKVNQLGPVTVTTTLAPAEPTIGDEITLEIRVEAEPDVEVLMPEFGEALNRYTILNFVPQQRIDDQGKTVLTQRYTLAAVPVGPAVYSADSDRVHRSSTRPETGSGRFRRLRNPHRSDRFPRQIGRSGGRGARTQAAAWANWISFAERSPLGGSRDGAGIDRRGLGGRGRVDAVAAPAAAGPAAQRVRSRARATQSAAVPPLAARMRRPSSRFSSPSQRSCGGTWKTASICAHRS